MRSNIRFTKLGETLGIAAEGLDLKRSLTPDERARLRQAQLDHIVVCIRDQDIDAADFRNAMACFGTPVADQDGSLHPDHPEIMVFSSDDTKIIDMGKRLVLGGSWHTDGAYLPAPFSLTALYGLKVPNVGGDTQFSNMYAAYEALPESTKRRIDGLEVINSKAAGREKLTSPRSSEQIAAIAAKYPPVRHPLVRVHPDTGRKSIYICGERMDHIVGMEHEESEALLQELLAHASSPQFQYRHKWRKGDIVIWDNRCALHKANGDYPAGEQRFMYRMTLKGTEPIPARAAASA